VLVLAVELGSDMVAPPELERDIVPMGDGRKTGLAANAALCHCRAR
jgi:hypothetical protein